MKNTHWKQQWEMQGEGCKTWQIFSVSFEVTVIQKLLGVFHLNAVSSEMGIICLREREKVEGGLGECSLPASNIIIEDKQV